ncbi:hypothetical protein, partial [Enterococcus faecalis]|uniref:hypothetical protein n=1 Tax=Enterococcus faecalis TaxID=1351 RepID=UPI003D6C5DF4
LGKQHENIQQLIQLFTQIQEATGNTDLQDTINRLNTIDGIVVRLKTDVDNIDVNAVTDADLNAIQAVAEKVETTVNS